MKDDRLYLEHIAECIERVREYTSDGREAFLADRRTQDAVIRNLQVMAESTQRLSDEIKQRHLAINWRKVRQFRNVVVHQYTRIRLDPIWEIVETDLDPLDNVVRQELRDLDAQQSQGSQGGDR